MLEVRGIHKNFPGVRALSDVSVEFKSGSIHALMGENGAGKSTLGKIIAGLYEPDSGEILLNGKKISFRGPADAKRAGIGIVHQELLFCENLTVAENLSLSEIPNSLGIVNFDQIHKYAKDCLEKVSRTIDPKKLVGELTIAQQQLVQIAATLAQGAKVIIFDEPTSSLSAKDVDQLLEQILELKSQGILCIYVSHRLDEIFRVCDTVTVLRDGEHVGTRSVSEIVQADLVEMMVGRNVSFGEPLEAIDTEVIAEIRGLTVPGKVSDISFQIRSGEILGICGLIGSGRTETLEALFGLQPFATGLMNQKKIPSSSGEAIKNGVALIPEDRKRHGLVLGMKIKENITFPLLKLVSKFGFVKSKKESELSQTWFENLAVKAPSTESVVGGLSGGNQQKVVIARWLASDSKILLVDEPTRGVDIGAKTEIHSQLRDLARSGKAVVVVSSELPELLALSNRILVFREGKISAELPGGATETELMTAMVS